MTDATQDDLIARIGELVDTEHDLRRKTESGELDPAIEQQRLAQLEATLDQCWDLLRQRRARIDAGESPDDANVNPVKRVEGYLQ
ncbi:DUF2630 family protein [Aldersonia sp. NBC_00410]|jgi:hypothetical protein|uniref:DUF2630 family protein n=1 Tax=Aldersonia sp. NBC_00410 TaxID=2975954 RepID=UPI00225845FF|nr:DUF2630 family protein [Aldersonia sp. NBC_00410]MCX5045609.1 DUF2630 family protein [Aldersonia sp. NBC_00410]